MKTIVMGDYLDTGADLGDLTEERIDEVLADFDRWHQETRDQFPDMDMRYLFLPEPHIDPRPVIEATG